MLADIRYAFRNLLRSPVFTTVALASLALGIGANTAIFSLTDQLLFRSLPVNHPEQLVLLSANGPNPGSTNTNYTADVTFSYPLFRDIRDRNPVFSGVLAHYPLSLTMSRNGRAESIKGELVSGNYFNVLGVRAVVGRTFTRDDNRIPGAHPVAVLSYGFWQRRFAADPAILNRTIDINAHPMTIVGVAQPGFRIPTATATIPSCQAPKPKKGSRPLRGLPCQILFQDHLALETLPAFRIILGLENAHVRLAHNASSGRTHTTRAHGRNRTRSRVLPAGRKLMPHNTPPFSLRMLKSARESWSCSDCRGNGSTC